MKGKAVRVVVVGGHAARVASQRVSATTSPGGGVHRRNGAIK
jgi:hypothetical protein